MSKTIFALAFASLVAVAGAALGTASLHAQRGRSGAPPVPTAPTPPGSPHVEQLKHEAADEVETMRVTTQQMVDQVFSFGELGFQEQETSKYLTKRVERITAYFAMILRPVWKI
jgi:aminobenzoyl-glutamate utilization protein B